MKNATYSDIPIIELTPVEKIWLKTIYKHFKQNKRLRYRQIRAELLEKLPENFKRTSIDERLVRYGLEEISLVGIIALEKSYKVLEKVDQIIYAIRDLLIKDPMKERFEIREITEMTGIAEIEAGLLFGSASSYGRFYTSAGKTGDGAAYLEFGIGHDDEYFNQYMDFAGIAPIILKNLREDDRRRKIPQSTNSFFDFNSEPGEIKMGYAPVFKAINVPLQQRLGFVLMPFMEQWSDRVYRKIIRSSIEAMDLQCLRADNKHGSIIMEDVWIGINQAAFIVADVTGRNPNVMYELGIAHTLAKPTIIITQGIDDIPFDFRHLRHYLYKDALDGAEEFEEKFKEAIQDIYQQYYPDIQL